MRNKLTSLRSKSCFNCRHPRVEDVNISDSPNKFCKSFNASVDANVSNS